MLPTLVLAAVAWVFPTPGALLLHPGDAVPLVVAVAGPPPFKVVVTDADAPRRTVCVMDHRLADEVYVCLAPVARGHHRYRVFALQANSVESSVTEFRVQP